MVVLNDTMNTFFRLCIDSPNSLECAQRKLWQSLRDASTEGRLMLLCRLPFYQRNCEYMSYSRKFDLFVSWKLTFVVIENFS